MKRISVENVWAYKQHQQVLDILKKSSDGLTLHEITSKISLPTCKNKKNRVMDILTKLRNELKLITHDELTKKYFLKNVSEDIEVFILNKYLLEKMIKKNMDIKHTEEKHLSSYHTANIHIFNHDEQINQLTHSKKKYSARLNKIVEKFEDALKDLDRLRKDIIKNEDISGYGGFIKNTGDGFAGDPILKKSSFTVILHTYENLLCDIAEDRLLSELR